MTIFDAPDAADFAPLSLTRPVFGLRCGIGTLLENQVRQLRPSRLGLWVRPMLVPVAKRLAQAIEHRYGVPCTVNQALGGAPEVLVDGRSWWPDRPPPAGQAVESGLDGVPTRIRLQEPGLSPERFFAEPADVTSQRPVGPGMAKVLHRPWDLVSNNPAALAADGAELLRGPGGSPAAPAGVHFIAADAIHIAGGVTLEPGCVLDATAGPVCIDEGAHVGANAVLRGPCYVGRSATVFPLTCLRAGANIGAICKVGGEVGNAIFHACANKAHEGYVGDSYVGEWVNLGAGTTTSNLKNTYGTIRAATARGREDTGLQFLGTIFGDHVKCGIGTLLDAGTYLGAGSQVAAVRPPQFVPSFRFVTPRGDEELELEKLAATAALVAARRGMTWTADETALLRDARALARELEGA